MKIAHIITEFKPSGPANVVYNIVENLPEQVHSTIFYFRGPPTLQTTVQCKEIGFGNISSLKDYDVIHSHGLRPDFLNALAGFFNHNQQQISTLHNYVKDELFNIYGRRAALAITPCWIQAWRRMDKLVTLSADAHGYYRNYFPEKKLAVIHNGIKTHSEHDPLYAEDHQIISDLKAAYTVLGSNAHIIYRKGLDTVIKALPELPDCAFVLVGDGPYRRTLIQLAEELGVADRCFFPGYRQNVASFLDYYDIYVMPSHTEGFGLALLEAMAFGLPCICSDIPVFKEIMTHKEGLFFKSRSIPDFIHAARKASDNKQLLSVAARKRYENCFTSKIMADAYFKLYSEMAGQK